MARAHFVKSAQKNIYETGKYVTYISEKGKRKGQQMQKLDRTIPANKSDKILIKKGQSYYWWQFKGSNKTISATPPKASQLTRSGYLSQLYDIQDRLTEIRGSVDNESDLESVVDDIKSDLESLKDECESSLDNMPEGLRESSSSGELLQERIDALDNAISELEGIDLDYDEPDDDDLKDQLKDAIDQSDLNEPDEDDPAFDDWDEEEERKKLVTEEMVQDKKDELMSEWLDEKCDEISNIDLS